MKKYFLSILFLLIYSAAFAGSKNYDVTYSRFNFRVDPQKDTLVASVYHVLNVPDSVREIYMELNLYLKVDSVVSEGNRLDFIQTGEYDLFIMLPEERKSVEARLEIFYRGIPGLGSGFGSWVRETHGMDRINVVWSLSEPFGCRDWWPGKNDLTDKIDSIDIIVTTPEAFRAAANGVLIRDEVVDGWRINHWKHRYPIVPYLVGVAVTNYAVYSDWVEIDGEKLEILNYVYPENLAVRKTQTAVTADFMKIFHDLFGPYPFKKEKYGHAEINWGGGMEHQTMTFLGAFNYEIIAHELAHQWFGDMVTTNSWADIWINEAFATYLSGLVYENISVDNYWPIWKKNLVNYITRWSDGSVYVPDTTSVNRIFDYRLSYLKAAIVLHMLRKKIGDEPFFTGLNNYLYDPKLQHGFAGTADLKRHLEKTSGIDLTEFLDDWYYGEGHPYYRYQYTKQDDGSYRIDLHQQPTHSSVSFFEMDVPITLYGDNRNADFLLPQTKPIESFVVNPGFEVTSMTLNREYDMLMTSALGLPTAVASLPESGITLFPNPASGVLEVSTLHTGIPEVFDVAGKKMDVSITQTSSGFRIDVARLIPGMYLFRLTSAKGSFSRLFQKM